nr:p21 protein [Areca palm velarivirus 1]
MLTTMEELVDWMKSFEISYEVFDMGEGSDFIIVLSAFDDGREKIVYMSNNKYFSFKKIIYVRLPYLYSIFHRYLQVAPFYHREWVNNPESITVRWPEKQAVLELLDELQIHYERSGPSNGKNILVLVRRTVDGFETINYLSNNSNFDFDLFFRVDISEQHSLIDIFLPSLPFHKCEWL